MKQSLNSVEKEKKALIKSFLPALNKVLRATVSEYYLTCGKAKCRCRKGKKHGPYLYLSSRKDGKIKMYKVPKGLENEVKEGVRIYKEIRKKLWRLCELNREILWEKSKISKKERP